MDFKSDRIVTLTQVFHDDAVAQAAIRELKEVGFTESQIGVTSRGFASARHSSVAGEHDGHEWKVPHTIVIVKAGTRADIAACVLNRFNRFDRLSPQAM